MLTPKDYRFAIWAQDASNLSGVVHSFSEVVTRIRDEPDCTGSDWVARHPITILYLDKLVSLAGGTVEWLEDDDTYGKALQACRERRAELAECTGTE